MFFAGLLASCFRYEQQPQPQATQSFLLLLVGSTRRVSDGRSVAAVCGVVVTHPRKRAGPAGWMFPPPTLVRLTRIFGTVQCFVQI